MVVDSSRSHLVGAAQVLCVGRAIYADEERRDRVSVNDVYLLDVPAWEVEEQSRDEVQSDLEVVFKSAEVEPIRPPRVAEASEASL